MNRKYKKDKSNSKFKEIIQLYIKENIKYYVIFLSIFAIGIVIGTFFVNNITENGREEIINYLNESINTLKENQISNFELLKISIKNNLIVAVILWFLGTTIIGITLCGLYILFRGFCFGYTISSIIALYGIPKGILFAFSSLFLQSLIFIPSVISICVSGSKFCNIILNKNKTVSVKEELLKHTIICSIITAFLMISSIIETFVSKNLINFLIKYF